MTMMIWGGHSPIMMKLASHFIPKRDIVYLTRNIDDLILSLGSNTGGKFKFQPIKFNPYFDNVDEVFNEAFFRTNEITDIVIGHRYRGKEDLNDELLVNYLAPGQIIRSFSRFKPIECQRCNVLVLSSPASRFVLRDQNEGYHVSKAALDSLVRQLSVKKENPNLALVSLVLGSFIMKERSQNYYESNRIIKEEIEGELPDGKFVEINEIIEVIESILALKTSLLNGSSIQLDRGFANLDPSNFVGKKRPQN